MSENPAFTTTREQRVVRVFVSSTFRDMHAERDELIKRTFPQLRRLCEDRGVSWSEVDLRWGITEEQSQRGEVLPICLAEIQRCRPYFIGLLGERYGWVPDEIPQELIEQEPWLQEHLHHSVTELEILHGVLNDPTMADRAFFYFRDRAFIDSLPPVEQPHNLELPTKDEIERLGQHEAERHAQERRQKLAALKAQITASGLPVRENYPNPQALGELVLRDLTEVIDRRYPKGSEPDPLDREALDHGAFAQSRAQVYIGRQSYYERLNDHARGDGPPLVVLGESGSGKSALLSNWALRYRSAHPEEMLLMHFIGATPYSADWAAMLRRIMGEFKRRFDIQHEIPDKPDELRAAFANWLHMAAAKGRAVLILDALNQIEDRDGAPDLVWLPPEIPPDIRLILSTLPGRPLDDLKKRGWPAMQIEVRYFGDVATLLHETGHLGVARTMREYIIDSARRLNKPERLAVALNNLAFMLDSSERDRAMELLGEAEQICRRQSDKELLKTVLGNKVKILLKAKKIDEATTLIEETSQLCRELHDLRGLQAMLGDQAILLRLAGEPDQALSLHREEELLCRQIGYQDGLADCLTNQATLLVAQRNLDAAMLLQQKAEEIYREMGNKDGLQFSLGHRGEILWLRGDLRDLLTVSREREELCRELNNRIGIAASLSTQALVLEAAGDLQNALELNRSAEKIYRDSGDSGGLASCLGNQAVILETLQRSDEAMQLLKEQEQIARDSDNKDQLASSLGEQALILKARGQLDEALVLLVEQERISREIGNFERLATALINHASFLANDMGRAVEGLPLAEEAYRLATSNGLMALAKGIKPILDGVRHKTE